MKSITEFSDDLADYIDGRRDEPPTTDGLSDEDRAVAEGWVRVIVEARGA